MMLPPVVARHQQHAWRIAQQPFEREVIGLPHAALRALVGKACIGHKLAHQRSVPRNDSAGLPQNCRNGPPRPVPPRDSGFDPPDKCLPAFGMACKRGELPHLCDTVLNRHGDADCFDALSKPGECRAG